MFQAKPSPKCRQFLHGSFESRSFFHRSLHRKRKYVDGLQSQHCYALGKVRLWNKINNLNDRWTFVKLYPQKTIFEPQTRTEPATLWWPVRRSEGCGFDPRLGSEIVFLRIELDERSSIIQDISKLPPFQSVYLKINNLVTWDAPVVSH